MKTRDDLDRVRSRSYPVCPLGPFTGPGTGGKARAEALGVSLQTAELGAGRDRTRRRREPQAEQGHGADWSPASVLHFHPSHPHFTREHEPT